jgi:hypothetical protein
MLKCVKCGNLADHRHHVIPRCQGGTLVVPICALCHRRHHSENGDFARWGRLGGKVTALNPEHWKANLVQFRSAAERSAAARRGWATRRARAAEGPPARSEQVFDGSKSLAKSDLQVHAPLHALISALENPYARARVPAWAL